MVVFAGYNCAEAVNFATEQCVIGDPSDELVDHNELFRGCMGCACSWIDIGRSARLCKCRPDYVFIDMDTLLRRLQRKRGRRFDCHPPLLDSDSE